MDVGAWLRGLGLESYVEAFEKNGVDAALLSNLTNEDLKDLGVTRMADRKRLLKAITELSGAIKHGANEPAGVETEGERRQVTVLFADLSSFTQLSSELDPEELHEILNKYFSEADSIIERYGGNIDKHVGDCVMGVFGAPVAHTNDPERAIRAAFDIHRAMTSLSTAVGRPLPVHIGIASG